MLQPLGTFNGIAVSDIAVAKTFYTQTLGLELVDEEMGLHVKAPNGHQVFLYPKPDVVPANYTVFNVVVADINASIDTLKAEGVNFEIYDTLPAPQDERGVLRGLSAGYGPDIAWFKDPSGNILSLIQEK